MLFKSIVIDFNVTLTLRPDSIVLLLVKMEEIL